MMFNGQYVGMPVMLRKLSDEFVRRGHTCFYLYQNKSSLEFERNDKLYSSLGIKATRLPINKELVPPYKEFLKYSKDELEEMYKFKNEYSRIVNNIDETVTNRKLVVRILEVLREYDIEYGIDFIVVWGTSIIPRIMHYYAKKNNKKVIILENGYFRPFTLQVDRKGVNFENSLPREGDFYKKQKIDSERLEKYLTEPEYARIDEKLSDEFLRIYSKFNSEVKIKEKKKSTPRQNEVFENSLKFEQQLPEDYVFVPFQLQSDAQIIRHSPQISTMEELIKLTLRPVINYNKRNRKDLKIIYKPHPLYKADGKSFDIDKIRSMINDSNYALLIEDYSTQELINKAKVVITINSTVGIEALISNKPVITLGQAFYNIKNLVCHIEDVEKLNDLFDEIIQFKPDEDLVSKFLYYLRFNYHVECYYPDADNKSIEKLVDHMLELNKEV